MSEHGAQARSTWIDFVVIGFQKCGTCSIRQWLREHPEVAVPATELSPFLVSRPWGLRTTWDEYLDGLKGQPSGVLHGTVDPTYALCDVAANAASLTSTGADTKIVALTRPRAERAFSAWNMARVAGWEMRSFEDALRSCLIDGPYWTEEQWLTQSYLEAGEYERILAEYARYFRVLSVSMYQRDVVERVADFLGIERRGSFPHVHQTAHVDGITAEALSIIDTYYSHKGASCA